MRIESVGATGRRDLPECVQKVTYRSGQDGLADWALVWPQPGEDWIVCLHGHGSHGDQLYLRPDIREAWLSGFRTGGLSILTPNLRNDAWMSPDAAADLEALVDWVRSEYGGRRFVFFGGSMGGAGVLTYAALHPTDVWRVVALGAVTDLAAYQVWSRRQGGLLEEIAGAIVSAYGSQPEERPEIYRRHSPLHHAERLTMPVLLSHGQADAIMPVDQARSLARKLQGRADFVYQEIPAGDHDAPLRSALAVPFALAGPRGEQQ